MTYSLLIYNLKRYSLKKPFFSISVFLWRDYQWKVWTCVFVVGCRVICVYNNMKQTIKETLLIGNSQG